MRDVHSRREEDGVSAGSGKWRRQLASDGGLRAVRRADNRTKPARTHLHVCGSLEARNWSFDAPLGIGRAHPRATSGDRLAQRMCGALYAERTLYVGALSDRLPKRRCLALECRLGVALSGWVRSTDRSAQVAVGRAACARRAVPTWRAGPLNGRMRDIGTSWPRPRPSDGCGRHRHRLSVTRRRV
jgi:hypothetical protein